MKIILSKALFTITIQEGFATLAKFYDESGYFMPHLPFFSEPRYQIKLKMRSKCAQII